MSAGQGGRVQIEGAGFGRFFGFGFVLIGAPHAAFARGSSVASCTAHEETAGQTKRHLGFWQK